MSDNNLEFILKLKDILSQPMQKAEGSAQKSFGKMDESLTKFQDHIKDTIRDIDLLDKKFEKLGRHNNNKPTGRHDKDRNGGVMGDVIGGNLISSALMSGAAMAKDIALSSVDAAMNFGAIAKSFEVLTGSVKRGKELTNELRDLKQSTIMGASVYKNAQTLMGFGIGDKEVIKDLKMIGNVAMGDQDRMHSLTLAFAQTRAAGKLMGQDLLQYINAGFNPLSVMSEKWKEFGLKKKTSIGQLKDMMEDGKISSDSVTKAFELATGKGGKYYNMMDQIGETAFGKMQKLKGNWAAAQIDIGNALMPIAENFMQAGSEMLHFMHISETVPDKLRHEKAEIDTLVGSITQLNQGNDQRRRLLDMLQAKYPDLFGNIDKEKIKNYELLDVLGKVNDQYSKRIQLATYDLQLDANKKEEKELLDRELRLRAGTDSFMDGFFWDKDWMMRAKKGGKYSKEDQIADIEERRADLIKQRKGIEGVSDATKIKNALDQARSILEVGGTMPGSWKKGEEHKNKEELRSEYQWYLAHQSDAQALIGHNWGKIQNLVGAGPEAGPAVTPAGTGNLTDAAAKGITGGGKKQIIININKEMISGGVNITAQNASTGLSDMERQVTEIFLRILNSANAVQD